MRLGNGKASVLCQSAHEMLVFAGLDRLHLAACRTWLHAAAGCILQLCNRTTPRIAAGLHSPSVAHCRNCLHKTAPPAHLPMQISPAWGWPSLAATMGALLLTGTTLLCFLTCQT